jgi:hypothetical protein
MPLIHRVTQLFNSMSTSPFINSHFINLFNTCDMEIPYVSLIVKHIKNMGSKGPLYVLNPHVLLLGLDTNGFNPWSLHNSQYTV